MTSRWLASLLLILSVLVGILWVSGGLLGVLALAGLGIGYLIIQRPLVALGLLILASTSFQVLSSGMHTGLPFNLSKILGALAFASWFLWAIRHRVPLTAAPQMIPLLLFGLVLLLSFTIPGHEQSQFGLLQFAQLFLLYFLVTNVAVDRKNLLVVLAFVTTAAVLSSLQGMAEYFLPQLTAQVEDIRATGPMFGGVSDTESLQYGGVKRVTGGLGDSNWFAYMVAAILPLNVFWWRRFVNPRARLLTATVTAIQLIGLVLSFTRTGFLGLGVAVLYLLGKRRLPIKPVLSLAFVALLLAPVVLPAGFWERMFSARYLREGSTPERYELASVGWQLWTEQPVLGYGFGQFGPGFLRRSKSTFADEYRRQVENGDYSAMAVGVHNLYLDVAIDYGLLGLLPFVGFLLLALSDAALVERSGTQEEEDLSICLRAGLIAFYACGLFGHAKLQKILWILTGLTAALRRTAFTHTSTVPEPSLKRETLLPHHATS